MALAAIILMTGDMRIGTSGTPKCKIGLNEVHIGLPLPAFAMPLAKTRLAPTHLTRAVTLGTIYQPEDAVAVGYLDMVVEADALEARALEEAAALAKLGLQGAGGPFHTTKLRERREVIDLCAARLPEDVASFVGDRS